MGEMRIENWCGYDIRFIKYDGEWWAILKDICDALNLQVGKVSQRLNPDMLEKIRIDTCEVPSRHVTSDTSSNGIRSRARKTQDMLIINEFGIYEALFASRKLEARKFRQWSAGVIKKLRKHVGLEGYEVMKMTEKDIQDQVDWLLDSIYVDFYTGKIMQSVTVMGGDVEQIPFE